MTKNPLHAALPLMLCTFVLAACASDDPNDVGKTVEDRKTKIAPVSIAEYDGIYQGWLRPTFAGSCRVMDVTLEVRNGKVTGHIPIEVIALRGEIRHDGILVADGYGKIQDITLSGTLQDGDLYGRWNAVPDTCHGKFYAERITEKPLQIKNKPG